MYVILIPGLWLNGSSWDRVVPALEAAGHQTRALTLPGMESSDADRSEITLRHHVDAVTDAIDACPPDATIVVVGHSLGAGIAWAATDARPDRAAHLVLVGGFPARSGEALAAGFATVGADLPLPDFGTFDEADLRELDDAARQEFRRQAVPSPARLTMDVAQLTDERRYAVPVTVVCPEFTAQDLRDWIEEGEVAVSELSRIRQLSLVDLPTGHWPQFTRPDELARIILEVGPTG
ncbi:MAG TPA: alpha/beta fold hydrolase [Microlunatus sp.]